MIAVLTVALSALAGALGLLLGRRIERGKIERERAEWELREANRPVGRGSVRLSTVQIRR